MWGTAHTYGELALRALLIHAKEEQVNQRDFVQQLLDSKLPTRGEHVSILAQYLPVYFQVKVFGYVFLRSIWALCTRGVVPESQGHGQ